MNQNTLDSVQGQSQHDLQAEVLLLRAKVAQLEGQVKDLTPAPKYKAREYKYLHEDILDPPAYQPSKEEISLAKARYAMENEIWELFHSLQMYNKYLETQEVEYPYTPEIVIKEGKNAVKEWNTAMNKWDNVDNLWEAFINNQWFEDVYLAGLSDIHSGDCTAFPASCSRCHAEEMFNIPSTITWGGKSAGYKLMKEYDKDWDEKNPKKQEK